MTGKMSEEKTRIDSLLKSGKISAEDHAALLGAIVKTPSGFMRAWEFLLNPFSRISSEVALIIGLGSMLVMCFVGMKAPVYFPGAIDLQLNFYWKSVTTLKLIEQNVLAIVLLSLGFYVSALVGKRRNLRFVDFLGFVSFARLPYAIFVVFFAVALPLFPEFAAQITMRARTSLSVVLFTMFVISMFIWHMVLMFMAAREASGLKGGAMWASYIGTLLVAEIIAVLVNTYYLLV